MSQKFTLTIELVPATAWSSSIFQIYKKSNQLKKWRKIKEEIFKKEGHRCWICGREGGRLEAHEFWEYDDENHIQKLVALHHLCGMCHKIKHIGFWCHAQKGNIQLTKAGLSREDLINHFCRTNNCSKEDFENYEREAFKIWKERSKYHWKQDFGEYDPNIINQEKNSEGKRAL